MKKFPRRSTWLVPLTIFLLLVGLSISILTSPAFGAPSDKIVSFKSDDVELTGTLNPKSGVLDLLLKTPKRGNIGFRSKPGELAASIETLALEGNRSFEVSQSSLVKKIILERTDTGVNLRVVLRSVIFPAYSWSEDSSGVRLKISGDKLVQTRSEPEVEVEKEIVAVAEPTLPIEEQPEERVEHAPVEPERVSPTPLEPDPIKLDPVVLLSVKRIVEEPAPVRETSAPRPIQNSASQKLLAYEFLGGHDAQGTRSLKLSLMSRPLFSMERESEISYVLSLPDSVLESERLTLPFFPPREYRGLTYVTAKQEDNQVRVIVGVDRGTSLTARPAGNAILISAND